jgi:hypothetical protein
MGDLLKTQPGSQLFTVFSAPRVKGPTAQKDGEFTVEVALIAAADYSIDAETGVGQTGSDRGSDRRQRRQGSVMIN